MAFERVGGLKSELSGEDFDVDGYIHKLSSRCDSSAELDKQRHRIQKVAEETAMELKQNVFKNYSLFIDTSKEISHLETEIFELSHQLHEQESLAHSMQKMTISTDGSQRQTDPSSKDEKRSIASLLETVEGCSSVTEVPGRYLIHSTHLVEIDPESLEPGNYVRAFLLNDSLMIATFIKRRRGPVKYKFAALFELDNMAIVDVKEDIIRHTFRILMFPDSHMYQAENPAAKKEWLALLESTKQKRKATRDALKTEDESSAVATKQLWQKELEQNELLTVDWLKDVPENLDVFIAQRDFEQAISLIEKTKAYLKDFSDSHILRDVRARLGHRIAQLSNVLMKELEASPRGSLRGGPRAARRAVNYLLRLGRASQACNLFLQNHQQVIHHDLSQIKAEGSTHLHVQNLSKAFYAGLRNAALEFQRAFIDNNGSYSAFIAWCVDELKHFGSLLINIAFSKNPLSIITECMMTVCIESHKLEEIGLDLTHTLIGQLHPSLCQAMGDGKKQIVESCAMMADAEGWEAVDYRNEPAKLSEIILEMDNIGVSDFSNLVIRNVVDLSSTTINFCRHMVQYMNDTLKIYVPELYGDIVSNICDAFTGICEVYLKAIIDDSYIVCRDFIIKNAQFTIDTFLPSFGIQMENQLARPIPEFTDLVEHLRIDLDKCLDTDDLADEDEEDTI
ncbi:exocyst complex component 8-like [Dysidea avara]|uniref:exocyst complex component 8-like n=1 Tax=Dysidea avara TaxID=196820 RepID=UPI0033196779